MLEQQTATQVTWKNNFVDEHRTNKAGFKNSKRTVKTNATNRDRNPTKTRLCGLFSARTGVTNGTESVSGGGRWCGSVRNGVCAPGSVEVRTLWPWTCSDELLHYYVVYREKNGPTTEVPRNRGYSISITVHFAKNRPKATPQSSNRLQL
jgi:hypothetical protein